MQTKGIMQFIDINTEDDPPVCLLCHEIQLRDGVSMTITVPASSWESEVLLTIYGLSLHSYMLKPQNVCPHTEKTHKQKHSQ